MLPSFSFPVSSHVAHTGLEGSAQGLAASHLRSLGPEEEADSGSHLPRVGIHPPSAPPPCSSGLRALEREGEVDKVALEGSPVGLAAHRPHHCPHSCGDTTSQQPRGPASPAWEPGAAATRPPSDPESQSSCKVAVARKHRSPRPPRWPRGRRPAWWKACCKY